MSRYTNRPMNPSSNRSSNRASNRGQGKRRRSRYRLAHPEKLMFAVILFLVCVLLLVWIGKAIFGGSSSKDEGPSVQIVQNLSTNGETGTLRSVYTSDMSTLPSQMSAYMAGMFTQNPNNYSKDPNSFKEEEDELDVDPYAYDYYIAIDAGHGGTDNGHEMDGVKEKEVTLAVAKEVVEYINSHAPQYYAFFD